ncbi:MAG TPA: hypothetical protein VGR91_04750 [Stellaceae bacterium]|nr:hypothetical protein [Stellaceae bacterium]
MYRNILFAVLLFLSPAAASAHAGKGPHGGPLADAGPYYVELLVQGSELQIFVFDDKTSTPVGTKGAKGTAVVLVGQKEDKVALQPAAGEAAGGEMEGKAPAAVGPGARIVVLVQMPGKPSVVARFAM